MKVKAIWNKELDEDRKAELQVLIDYIRKKIVEEKPVNLIFICTHNSRRSILAQVWAHFFSNFYHRETHCFSGGTEVTACDKRTIAVLEHSGFEIQLKKTGNNPHYSLSIEGEKLNLFSKLYDSKVNPTNDFAAIMTCSQADENCPFITGAESRISIPYDDPKKYDEQPDEMEQYNKINRQIASEMHYVFQKLN